MMKLKEFGKTGRKVSELGMGTYYDPLWIATGFLGWKRGWAEKVEAMKTGLDLGVTLLDTAEIYQSEDLVAKALAGRRRDEVFVATKAWSNHLHREDLVRSCEKSLTRLGVSYLDLYQIHFPNPRVPIRETMEGMEELVRRGKLLNVGVSNFNLHDLEEANSALPRSQLSSIQLDYNLAQRRVERDILPYCKREGLALLAYYPLAHGSLASDYRLGGVASRHGKTQSQVALSWLMREGNVFPIPRASRPAHVLEDVGASGWDLNNEDIAELDVRFPASA